jgi:hypothetical protein
VTSESSPPTSEMGKGGLVAFERQSLVGRSAGKRNRTSDDDARWQCLKAVSGIVANAKQKGAQQILEAVASIIDDRFGESRTRRERLERLDEGCVERILQIGVNRSGPSFHSSLGSGRFRFQMGLKTERRPKDRNGSSWTLTSEHHGAALDIGDRKDGVGGAEIDPKRLHWFIRHCARSAWVGGPPRLRARHRRGDIG